MEYLINIFLWLLLEVFFLFYFSSKLHTFYHLHFLEEQFLSQLTMQEESNVLPLTVFKPTVLTSYFASTDSRDKLVKACGNLFKITAIMLKNPNHASLASACSDARSMMRLLCWLNNLKKMDEAVEVPQLKIRGFIYIIRILLDAIFAFLDNIAYCGKFFTSPQNKALTYVSSLGRQSLFFGYVLAVIVDAIDLRNTTGRVNQVNKALMLTRNAFDMLSSVGNVFRCDLGSTANAWLGFISAVIATREQLLIAHKKEVAQKLKKI